MGPRTSQCGEASTSPKRTITKPAALCAPGGYKASFEACLVDLGGLEKHHLLTALLENSRKCHSTAWFSVNSHKAFPLGPVFQTGCCRPTAVLNGFKLVIVTVPTKLIITTVKGGWNNHADPKVCKSCCHETTWAIILMTPIHYTGSLRCACVYIAARRLDYCTQEAVLSQRAARCGLHTDLFRLVEVV